MLTSKTGSFRFGSGCSARRRNVSWLPSSQRDLRAADNMTLRYDLFLGDFVFKVGDADLSTHWGWVPLLDFAIALRLIAQRLAAGLGGTETFEFTDSDAEIVLRREGQVVEIEADYAEGRGQTSVSELTEHAERFCSRIVRELTDRYPPLAENVIVADLARERNV